MKKIRILPTACTLASLLMLAACAQDELVDGKYPLAFTASVKTSMPATRVIEDQNGESKWDGNEIVKVKIGSETKDYKMSQDGNLSSTQPFYWNSTTETKQVTAWYPAAFTFKDQLKDQSTGEKYMNCDVLKTDQTSITYTDQTKKLTFKHQMAKVIINLLQNDGTTAMTDATSVEILCASSFTYSEGQLSGIGNHNYISPFRQENNSSYKAMIIPQDMAGDKFIKVVYDGDTYYWTPGSGEANLNVGTIHTYNITVRSTHLDVEVVNMTSSDISWGEQENATESGTVN